jgi:hypothetical protein
MEAGRRRYEGAIAARNNTGAAPPTLRVDPGPARPPSCNARPVVIRAGSLGMD